MEKIIGIDLGTTNSVATIVQEGKCIGIADSLGHEIIPSIIGVSSRGKLLVGKEAKELLSSKPENTVKSVKRKMGGDHLYNIRKKEYSPTEISAMILKSLKKQAEDFLKCKVKKAVITVPAYFNDLQRQATIDAAKIAKLEVVRLLNEPSAAALAYRFGSNKKGNVLVYDLGGGTFDVSVVEMDGEVTEVLATHGNNLLGGDDFDHRLAHWLDEKFHEEHGIYLMDDPNGKAQIYQVAEKTKIALSKQTVCKIKEEEIFKKGRKKYSLEASITREEFEELIRPLLLETNASIDKALGGAKLKPSDIDQIILVGGSTQIPLVRHLVEHHMGQPALNLVDPDLCVALGAGYQAAVQAGEDIDSILVDVTPYSLGVRVVRETTKGVNPDAFSVVIPQNSAIPCSRAELYTNPYEDMDHITIAVYQGEQEDVSGNIRLGSFDIVGIPKCKPNSLSIEVKFDFDVNGILKVTAKERSSEEEFSIEIRENVAKLDTQDIQFSQQKMDELFEEKASEKQEDDVAVAEAKSPSKKKTAPKRKTLPKKMRDLCDKAEAISTSLEPEDAEDILQLLEVIRTKFNDEDQSNYENAVDELSKIIYYIEN